MKTSFRYSSCRCESSALEITEAEIISRDKERNQQYSLPRFISQLETKSHRGTNNLGKIKILPKVCQINPDKGQETRNMAVYIFKYQLSDLSAKQRHLESIRQNLEHRLEVAKAGGNDFLIDLLDDEFKQLTTSI